MSADPRSARRRGRRWRFGFAVLQLSLLVVSFVSVMYARSHGWPDFATTVFLMAQLAFLTTIILQVGLWVRSDDD